MLEILKLTGDRAYEPIVTLIRTEYREKRENKRRNTTHEMNSLFIQLLPYQNLDFSYSQDM